MLPLYLHIATTNIHSTCNMQQLFFIFIFMKTINRRSECPITYTLDIFGDKWTMLIIRDLLLYGKDSFSEFLCSDEKIATNILTDRLNVLLQEGFITKHTAPTNKSKFLYRPTEKAIEMIPVLMEITLWAEKYNPDGAPLDITEPLKKNRTKALRDFKKKVEERFKEE
jgi:DNA-binding HxlR family transcriptional regulator